MGLAFHRLRHRADRRRRRSLGGFRGAQWVAVGLAGTNAVVQLAHMQHYPAWSIAAIVLDVLVIYALVVYGPAMERDWAEEERLDRATELEPGPGIT